MLPAQCPVRTETVILTSSLSLCRAFQQSSRCTSTTVEDYDLKRRLTTCTLGSCFVFYFVLSIISTITHLIGLCWSKKLQLLPLQPLHYSLLVSILFNAPHFLHVYHPPNTCHFRSCSRGCRWWWWWWHRWEKKSTKSKAIDTILLRYYFSILYPTFFSCRFFLSSFLNCTFCVFLTHQ